jgi:multidrug efflux pump subunit AcrA (membrane-fusion protein)
MPATETIILVLLVALTGPVATAVPPAAPPAASGSATRIEQCLVSLIQDVQVPAQEAGVLQLIPVAEGDQVAAGTLLAQIDDRRAMLAREAADLEYRAAYAKATDDIAVRYAIAAHEVAVAEHLDKEQANLKVQGAVSKAEVRRYDLIKHRAALEIDKARLDQKVAVMTAQVKSAEVKSAEDGIARRKITSPIDGEVVALLRQPGEWVNPGDVVLQVIRMNQLRVEGFLSASAHNPEELVGRPVRIEVERAHGQKVSLPGKLVWVNPQVQAGGRYRVRAEVDNRQEKGQWLLRPGMTAAMAIDAR